MLRKNRNRISLKNTRSERKNPEESKKKIGGLFKSSLLVFVFYSLTCFSSFSFSPSQNSSFLTKVSEDNEISFSSTFVTGSQLKITNYNVLNLFDAQDDGDRQDPTFLSKSHKKKKDCDKKRSEFYKKLCKKLDWTEKKFQFRISLLAEALRSQGDLPDILALQEVENEFVLQALAKELAYKPQHVLITEGSDSRGIDVGLIYKTEKLKLLSHRFLKSPHAKRDILIARFEVLEKRDFVLDIYVNHWPSQYNKDPQVRFRMGMLVRSEIEAQKKALGSRYGAVVTGDFNVTELEAPNGITHALQSPFWKHHLKDVQYLASLRGLSAKMPKGTYWYHAGKKWSRLDRILVTQNMVEGEFEIVPKSFVIGNESLLTDTNLQSFLIDGSLKTPYRYDFLDEDKKGYSDHLPVSVIFQIK